MTHVPAAERLIAAATEIGLKKSVAILQEALVQSLCQVLLHAPLNKLPEELRKALGFTEPPPILPQKAKPRKRDTRPAQERWHGQASLMGRRRTWSPKTKLRGPGGTAYFSMDGLQHVLHLPDGRTWRASRRRDLGRRATRAGFTIS